MNKSRVHGFTLIELLTVIAILGILMALTVGGISRVKEKSKVVATLATLDTLSKVLDTYYTDYGSYPPAYGMIRSRSGGNYNQTIYPFLAVMGIYKNTEYVDTWNLGTADTDDDGVISVFEYVPPMMKVGPDSYQFSSTLYTGGGEAVPLKEERSFVYIPVNKRHAQKVAKYYWELMQSGSPDDAMDALNARVWDWNNKHLKGLRFPPSKYDSYVLLSMGPGRSTGGILPLPIGNEDDELYDVTALRAYYLATRDANDDGELDFDFNARRTRGQDDLDAYSEISASLGLDTDDENYQLHHLPNHTGFYGPIIKGGNL